MWGITHEGRHQESSSAVCRSSPNLWIDKVTVTSVVNKIGRYMSDSGIFFLLIFFLVPFLVGPS